MAVRSKEDWDYLFGEFEFLLSFGVHPQEAVRQLDYPSAESMLRAYQRRGRTIPAALAREEAWLHRVRRKAVAS